MLTTVHSSNKCKENRRGTERRRQNADCSLKRLHRAKKIAVHAANSGCANPTYIDLSNRPRSISTATNLVEEKEELGNR